jgi:hypothetical protein
MDISGPEERRGSGGVDYAQASHQYARSCQAAQSWVTQKWERVPASDQLLALFEQCATTGDV